MELDESRPVIKNFTGDWCVDASRSDDLGPLWTAMSVGWLTRRLVSAVKIDTHIYHTREAFIATDNSILGSFTINLVPDGKWRDVIQVDKSTRQTRCTFSRESGEMKIETVFPNGTLSDTRILLTRSTFEQLISFRPADAPPQAVHPVYRRVLVKRETEEERIIGEEAEEHARQMIAHQAATFGLVSAPVNVEIFINKSKTAASAEAATAVPDTSSEVTDAAIVESGVPTNVCDFSGTWILDRSRSDTLDGLLTLMGVPWIARKVANSLEITVILKHDVACNKLVAEDHSSMGVTTMNYLFDGLPHQHTGSDGKTSTITACVVPVSVPPVPGSGAPWPDGAEKVYGCVRFVCVLPDGLGETVDTRSLMEDGKTLRQHLQYTRGSGKDAGKQVSLTRYLTNQHYDATKFAHSVQRMHGISAGSVSVKEKTPATGAGAQVSTPIVPADSSPAEPAAKGSAPDPFFVSMSGVWAVDNARSEPFEPLWAGMGVGWLARKVVGMYDITTAIVHTPSTFKTEEKSSIGVFTSVHEFGKWGVIRQPDGKHYFTQALQTAGAGDKGSSWLGDIGSVPPAWLSYAEKSNYNASSGSAAFSDDEEEEDGDMITVDVGSTLAPEAQSPEIALRSLPVQIPTLMTSEVVVTSVVFDVSNRLTLLKTLKDSGDMEAYHAAIPSASASKLIVRYNMESREQLHVTYLLMSDADVELVRVNRFLTRKETPEQAATAGVAESARIQHACTLLMSRRAAADELRSLYLRRKEEKIRAQEARASATTTARFRVKSSRLAAGMEDLHPDDTYELSDGVQCSIQ